MARLTYRGDVFAEAAGLAELTAIPEPDTRILSLRRERLPIDASMIGALEIWTVCFPCVNVVGNVLDRAGLSAEFAGEWRCFRFNCGHRSSFPSCQFVRVSG
jgi:hypothetical protein